MIVVSVYILVRVPRCRGVSRVVELYSFLEAFLHVKAYDTI